MPTTASLCLLAATTACAVQPMAPPSVAATPGRYLILVDPGKDSEFLPAARAMARLHKADVETFNPARLDDTLATLRKNPPRFVVFVLPPEKIDADLAHAILEMSTHVDDDPFVDFEYAFVTGRDGAAALRFVKHIEAAWRRDYGNQVALLASWEGLLAPPTDGLSALKALGLSGKLHYVRTRDGQESRSKAARAALENCQGKDALLFMSHGYPDRMDLCFRGKDLRQWKPDLSHAILFNCACFNGAPGRWYHPKGDGYEDRGVVAAEESVALALLDTGVAGYFAGVDMWHGPLNSQVFCHVTDDGMRLGQAAKAMFDRLALEFLPKRIHFEPTALQKRGGPDFWVQNQRHNGAAMILYGDPAFAPFARRARHLLTAKTETAGPQLSGVRLELAPLLANAPGTDFAILPVNRMLDYYSLRSDPAKSPPTLELARVVPLPPGFRDIPKLCVVSAKSGDRDVPTGPVQAVVEETPEGKQLHLRVPVLVSISEPLRLLALAKRGMTVELAVGDDRTKPEGTKGDAGKAPKD